MAGIQKPSPGGCHQPSAPLSIKGPSGSHLGVGQSQAEPPQSIPPTRLVGLIKGMTPVSFCMRNPLPLLCVGPRRKQKLPRVSGHRGERCIFFSSQSEHCYFVLSLLSSFLTAISSSRCWPRGNATPSIRHSRRLQTRRPAILGLPGKHLKIILNRWPRRMLLPVAMVPGPNLWAPLALSIFI